jgi:bacterioferritin-associated ferredoxin
MNHDRYQRRSESAGKRLGSQKQGRFTELDPSKMGLSMPDWLQPAASPADAPAASPVAEDETSAPSVSPPFVEARPVAEEARSRTVVEGMKVVCICKGIKQRVFWKALDSGMRTKEEINRFTGSGSGGCQGRRCGPRIAEMLQRLPE